MFPAYSYRTPYPNQKAQMPSSEYYHPRWEVVPPQLKGDLVSNPSMYDPWHNNYGYPVPMQWHTCYNNHPSYCSMRPPYPHYPPMPSYHNCCGVHPAYFEPYPLQYTAPPHYSMELPRYEYDKSIPREHYCCGCPNGPHHVKEEKNVKIEEHEAEPEKGKVIPVYMNSGEQQRQPIKTEAGGNRQVSQGAKSVQKPAQEEPNAWNGWFPLGIKSVKPLMRTGEGRKPDEKNKTGDGGLQFPIIWVPCDNSNKDGGKDQRGTNGNGKQTQFDDHDSGVQKRTMASSSNVKSIPVKQMGEPAKNNMDEAELKPKGRSVEKAQVSGESVQNASRKQPSSPTKTSKLPPVCLRVEPLPKKKNGNGSSRSPSPPGHKDKQMQSDATEQEKKCIRAAEDNKMEQKTIKEIKVRETIEKHACKNEEEIKGTGDKNKVSSESSIVEDGLCNTVAGLDNERKAGESVNCKNEVKGGEDLKEASNIAPLEEGQARKSEKKILSGTEAAVAIQSAYRGYEVRRWEPLKKLKQISKVRQEAAVIRGHLEVLDSHGEIDSKQKAEFGETIMKLLLELDTIQGLHPSVRDIRKSVAKELINLQEKLDSFESKRSGALAQRTSAEIVYPFASNNETSTVVGDTEATALNEDGNRTLPSSELLADSGSATGPRIEVPELFLADNEAQTDVLEEVGATSAECQLQAESGVSIKEIPEKTDMISPASEIQLGILEQTSDDKQMTPYDTLFSLAKEMESLETNADDLEVTREEGNKVVTLQMPEVKAKMDDESSLLELPQTVTLDHKEMTTGDTMSSAMEEVKSLDNNDTDVAPKVGSKADASTETSKTDATGDQEGNSVSMKDVITIGDADVALDQIGDGQQESLDAEFPSVGHEGCMEFVIQDKGSQEGSLVETSPKQEIADDPLEPEIIVQEKLYEEDLTPFKDENKSLSSSNIQAETDNKMMVETNEKLRELLEMLIASGKEQQAVISSLSGKVEDLERKLARRKRQKIKRPRVPAFRSTSNKPLNS